MITNVGLGVLLGVLPAAMFGGGALLCALLGAARPRSRPSLHRWIALLATAGAFTSAVIELKAMTANRNGVGVVTFQGALVVDRFHVFGTVLVCAVVAIAVLGSEAYVRRAPARAGAFCALVLAAAAAATLLVAQHEAVAFTATFALLVVSLVLLTAMTKTSSATAESALRQLLLGGVALATSVYGLTLVYIATGSTDLSRLAGGHGVGGSGLDTVLAAVGVALTVIGLVGVAGAPPLAGWLRGVGETAPGPVAGYSAALGSVTALMVLARFAVEGFGAGSSLWTVLVTVLAVIAMLSGAILALRAATLRGLVVDLAVAQAGFLLLAVTATGRGTDGVTLAGPTALLYALPVAAIALLGGLLLAGVLDAAGLDPGFDAHRGLGRRAPATAACLALCLLGLAGVPPLAGFLSRLLIAQSVLDAGTGWAVGAAAVATVLGTWAVIRWLTAMYAEDTGEAPFAVRTTPPVSRVAAWSTAVLVVLLTVFAGPFIALAGGGATALH